MRTNFPAKIKPHSEKQFQDMWISTRDELPVDEDVDIIIWDGFTITPHKVGARFIRKQLLRARKEQVKKGWTQQKFFVTHFMYCYPPKQKQKRLL